VNQNLFEKIYRENYNMVLNNAYLVVNDRDAAENIASFSFLTLMRYQDFSNLTPQVIRSLLKVIAKNFAHEHISINKRKVILTEYYTDLEIHHDDITYTAATHNIHRNVNTWTPRLKDVMQLTIAGNHINEITKEMSSAPAIIHLAISQLRKHVKRSLLSKTNYPDSISPKQYEIREQIIKIKAEVNDEFIKYYTKHPHKLYNISPRQYEIFVAELLKDMGYEVWLNNHTRDGGRDIIAVLKTPSNDSIVTLVECKKYSLENPVPIEIVRSFLHTIRDEDKANVGWIVTTSTFSREAKKHQQEYKWQLSLKDNKDLATLCSNYGKWKRTNKGSGLWLPDNPLG
jgi:restriction endonuclease Mrr